MDTSGGLKLTLRVQDLHARAKHTTSLEPHFPEIFAAPESQSPRRFSP